MARKVEIELSDELYDRMESAAHAVGTNINEWIAQQLSRLSAHRVNGTPVTGRDLDSIAGCVSLPPIAHNNERLDDLLTDEYVDPHEDDT